MSPKKEKLQGMFQSSSSFLLKPACYIILS